MTKANKERKEVRHTGITPNGRRWEDVYRERDEFTQLIKHHQESLPQRYREVNEKRKFLGKRLAEEKLINEELRVENEELRVENEELRVENEELRVRLEDAQNRLEVAQNRLEVAQNRLEVAQNRLEELELLNDQFQKECDEYLHLMELDLNLMRFAFDVSQKTNRLNPDSFAKQVNHFVESWLGIKLLHNEAFEILVERESVDRYKHAWIQDEFYQNDKHADEPNYTYKNRLNGLAPLAIDIAYKIAKGKGFNLSGNYTYKEA